MKKLKTKLPVKRQVKVVAKTKLALGDTTCQNCGAGLFERYCAVCGQRHFTGKNPYWEMIEDLTDHLISPESKLWRTFSHLLFLPGVITRNYFKGMRASYAPPIRLYLISLVAFFAMLAVLDVAVVKLSMVATESVFTEDDRAAALVDIEIRIQEATDKDQPAMMIEVLERIRDEISARQTSRQEGIFSVTGAGFQYVPNIEMFTPLEEGSGEEVSAEMIDDFFELTAPGQADSMFVDFIRRVKNGFIRAAEDPGRLNNSLNMWVPRVMIIFVPLFGIFLRVFYWGKEHFVLNQMIFSLHFHTALFFYLTFFLVALEIFGGIAEDIGLTLATLGFPIFLFMSLKNAYGDGWNKTFLKFGVISVFYAIGFSIMLAAVFLLGLADV